MYILKHIWKNKIITALFFLLIIASISIVYIFPYITSRIINVGIQQNGIESPIPEFITKWRLQQFSFLSDSELSLLDESYTEDLRNYDFKQLCEYGKTHKESLMTFLPSAIAFSDSKEYNDLEDKTVVNVQNSYLEFIKNYDEGYIQQKAINVIRNEYKIGNIDVAAIQTWYIIRQGSIMLFFVLLGSLITLGVRTLKLILLSKIKRDTRNDIFSTVIRFTPLDISKFSETSLITRAVNDTEALSNVIGTIIDSFFYCPMCIIIGFVFAYLTAPMLSWLIVFAFILLICGSLILFKKTSPVFSKLQYQFDKINLRIREMLSGLYIIKIFNNELYENNKFEKCNKGLYNLEIFIGRFNATINPLISFGFSVLTLLVFFIGYYFINIGSLQVGDIIAFSSYCTFAVGACTSLGKNLGSIPRAKIVILRINEVINKKPSINQNLLNNIVLKNRDKLQYKIDLKNLFFKYNNNDFKLRNINFSINKGETIAIVGGTGSGKTTLLNLLLRLFDPDKGQILFNGINVKEIDLKTYRDLFALSIQNSFIFSGTVGDNIRFGNTNNLDQRKIFEYIKDASADDFISDNERSLEYKVTQGSKNFSGGQKQRLSIARTLASEKEILIFDDCFTALDYNTESKIWNTLCTKYKKHTKVIVTSRFANVVTADKIIVLENGEQIGFGTHCELIKTCNQYKKILLTQFSKQDMV